MHEETEQHYAVASHLDTSAAIGPIPERTFYIALSAFILGLLPAYMMFVRLAPESEPTVQQLLSNAAIAIGVGLTPAVLLSPFMMWFLKPPAEHGLMRWLAHSLSRKTYQHQHIKNLKDVSIDNDGIIHCADGVRAILSIPTVNLDLSSVTGKRRHIAKFGRFLDGLSTHPFQIIIRTQIQSQCTAIDRMRKHKNPMGRRLADWLANYYDQRQTIDRRRYLVLPAPDIDSLHDRIDSITRSLTQHNLEPDWINDPLEVKAIIDNWWTWRPHPERLGPESVIARGTELQIDGEFVKIFALAKLPNSITTNWWYPIVDGDLPVDVVMTCEQQNMMMATTLLDMRYNNLAASTPSPKRAIALQQIQSLRMAFETKVRPWDIQILFVVRGHDQKTCDRASKRLQQQTKDLGGEVSLLRWEQFQAMQSAQPLCGPMLVHRHLYVESGTLARCTPLSASRLHMLDGVPWGLAGSSLILLTTQHMRTGKHFGWFGFTGSGKGFGLRCYLLRRHFADRLRMFIWDADNATHEYAGRFCSFLKGVSIPLCTLEDVAKLELDPAWQVVCFDVSAMPSELHSKAFASIKLLVENHVLAYPGETAFVVDEAMTLAEHPDQQGARALGDAVLRWRKYGVECHIVTQRVSDWFNTSLGHKIQSNLAVKWYGAQEDSELAEVARHVRWSPEELDRVAGAGIGQGLLVAFGRRVWADLYDHIAPFEYDIFSTEPAERLEFLPAARPKELPMAYATNGITPYAQNGAAANV